MYPKSSAALAALFVTSCTNPVFHQESGIKMPILWQGLTESAADAPLMMNSDAKIDQSWWRHFGDATLNQIIDKTLANNKTLAIAKARVDEARANRGLARSALFPQIDAALSASRGNQGLLTSNKIVGMDQISGEANWELDLFGKNQARTAATTAILESTEATCGAVRVALLADVARQYFDLRNYKQQIRITQKTVESARKTLALTESQFRGALASAFDVQRASAAVSALSAQLPPLKSAYRASLNRIAVLSGSVPGAWDSVLKTPDPLKPLDAQIIVTAPAAVLSMRPDVRAAERQFAAGISARDAAVGELFPTISLGALFGFQDTTLISTRPWNIGGNLVQPILNFGRIESQIDAADAREKQAYLTYQQTVLLALEDMENALTRYLNETVRHKDLTNAVLQNKQALTLSTAQYASGETDLSSVLILERDTFAAESDLAAGDAQLRKDLVSIYTAAGGGWDIGSKGL